MTQAARRAEIDRSRIPRSYRDYLDLLRKNGEAVEIEEEIDWNLEAGAILRHACETGAPHPIFNKIKDCPGFRLSDLGPTRSRTPGKPWRRLAMLLGFPDDATPAEMQDAFIEAKTGKSYPPQIVKPADAPCKENIWLGDQVDLNKLPAPLLHDGDYARYLQTAGAIIVRSPDGSWTNWSVSRGMIVDKSTMVGLWLPFQHNGMIYRMWQKEGKDCPFAIAFGVPPVAATQLSSAPPEYEDEYNYASALLGEPLDMVKCETNDLLVPSASEIVLEGTVSATQTSVEGPFGEFPGYLTDITHDAPQAAIQCVTFRNNAILPAANPGIPVDSTHVNGCFFLAADAVIALRKGDIPIIDGLYLFESASHWFVIRVPDDWHHRTGLSMPDFIKKIASIYWTQHVGHSCSTIIVVGEDIPPDDPLKVIWGFATRNNPEQGIFHFPQYASEGSGLQIYLDAVTKFKKRGDLVAYSCLQIEEQVNHPMPRVLSFETNYSEPLKEKIRSKWTEWGFDR
jgi:phenylphosphate carboxylase alpha subunit